MMETDDPRDQEEILQFHRHVQILSGPSHAGYDITNRCNFSCLHCYNRSGSDGLRRDELTDDEARMVLHQFAELQPRSFCFCGGEPLLRRELVLEGTELLTRHNVGVSMVTNGWLLTPELARELRAAGMSSVQCSVDGARPESHDRMRACPGAFSRVQAAIAAAREAGLAVGIAFCPTAFNIDEIGDALRLADSVGAHEFRVQPLMILGRAVQNRAELEPTSAQYRQLVRTIKRYESETRMRLEWGDPVEHLVRLTEVRADSVPFVDLKSDGSLVTSTYLPLVVGNVRQHSLVEYWEAGLQHVWMSPLVQRMARGIRSAQHFYRPDSPLPITYFEHHMVVDLIDDRLLDMSEQLAERRLIEHGSSREVR